MKLSSSNSKFESCPEFTGSAVCVDITPLRKRQGQYGEQEVFKVVFEVDMDKDEGGRYCVWSRNFTPTLNEKSNFRKFLRGWFGRDLTETELKDFETDVLLGKPAQVVVVHEFKDGETYANIAACTAHRGGAPLAPSGQYQRVKDRQPGAGPNGADAAGSYRKAERAASDGGDLGTTKIHVGRCKGLELRDLSPDQVQALIENWLPKAKANAKPLADDKRLMAALDWWTATQEPQEDNVPY